MALTSVYGGAGAPFELVADRGMEFLGRVTRTAMRMRGHSLSFIPADLHQSNLVEHLHRTLISMIQAIRTKGIKQRVPGRADGRPVL